MLLTQFLFSQEKKIAVYYEGQGYLQPFIEASIDSLKNNKTQNYLFNSTSLNQLKLQNKIESEKEKLLQIYFNPENSNFNLTDSEMAGMQEINNQINKSSYLLVVKTITLLELIEFQFQLFIPKDSLNNLNTSYAKLVGTEDLFINPKDKNYKKEITNALQRLFKESNSKPRTILKYFERNLKTGDTILVPLNSTVELNGINSVDEDTEEIFYHWRNIHSNNADIKLNDKITFIENEPIQKIEIHKNGIFKIGFKVFDGIENSNEIVVVVNTIEKPSKLVLYDSITYSEHNFSVLNKETLNSLNQSQFFPIYRDSIVKNEILITTKKIGLKFDNKLHEKYIFHDFQLDSANFYKKPKIKLLKLNSTFTLEDRIKSYYLYIKDKNDFVSEPQQIIHKFNSFFILGISTSTNLNFIFKYKNFDNSEDQETKILSDSTSINETLITQKFSINYYILKNISVSVTIPFNTHTIKYKDYIFEGPAIISTSLSLHQKNNISNKSGIIFSHLKLFYNTYGEKIESEKSGVFDNGYYFAYHSIGGSIGLKSKLIRTNLFHVDLSFNGGGSFFLKELKDLADIEFSIGLIFKFISL
ncbi:hypothetical protein [Gelidibacter salicanalis]|uniref:Uncharacterized protein n=1 Tax=Gelidibacter salicanalis TaxID=291193 RepID=A0A934KTA8_9FLAO|nr:hypothetical protein [Gelidibacter salicanalis]MBJ7880332.1 hypothetical protein [Gelidibacter salicanalis]